MGEIDKATVWAMAMCMRLFAFLEYLHDANQQIAAYLREFMETDPKLLLGDE